MLRFREKLKGNVTHYWGLSEVNGLTKWEEPKSKHPEKSDVFTGLTDVNGVELFSNDTVEYTLRGDNGKPVKEYGTIFYAPKLSCFMVNDNQQRLTAKTIIDRNITVVKSRKASRNGEEVEAA